MTLMNESACLVTPDMTHDDDDSSDSNNCNHTQHSINTCVESHEVLTHKDIEQCFLQFLNFNKAVINSLRILFKKQNCQRR